jgi:hypothetical protein
VAERKKPEDSAAAEQGRPRARRDAGDERESRTQARFEAEREIDRMATSGGKTAWAQGSDPAAGDPLTEEELKGLTILGGSSLRDDAIAGVSDPVRDGSAAPHERPTADMGAGGPRRNPPLVPDVATEDGGISESGGVAGGDRGHGGTSEAGAGTPEGETKAGPGEYRATSRFDYDHGTVYKDDDEAGEADAEER